jgi:hypothetical protein
VETVIVLYFAVGVAIGAGLLGWVAVSSIRRHGFRDAVRAATRESLADPPLVGTFARLCVIAYPVLFVWAVVTDGMDVVAAAVFVLLWLGGLALLRWHLKTKARRQQTHGGSAD